MFIVFDSQQFVNVDSTFALGLVPPVIFARSKADRPSLLDIAFESGRTAALESGFGDVLPPITYGAAEAEAFAAGAAEGWKELEYEIDLARQATVSCPDDLDAWHASLEARDAFIGHA